MIEFVDEEVQREYDSLKAQEECIQDELEEVQSKIRDLEEIADKC